MLFKPIFAKCAMSYALYEPEPVNVKIVFDPDVVIVADPTTVPVKFTVGIERMTTPEPPAAPFRVA